MGNFMKYATFIKDNPVVLLDLAKYAVAALLLFGIELPDGIDVAVTGFALAALTLVTRSRVTPVHRAEQAVQDALAMPAPDPAETGEAEYVATLEDTQVIAPVKD